jgi:hypothetical protein
MITIYKYKVEIRDKQNIELPIGAVIRHFAFVGLEAYIWVELDTKAETREITLYIYGTGHSIKYSLAYIGTAINPYGFVWHLYF